MMEEEYMVMLYDGHNDELEHMFQSISFYIGYSIAFVFGMICSYIYRYIR